MQIANPYYSEKRPPLADRVLLSATVFAVVIHAVVIFGISFAEENLPNTVVQEVTTVLTENLQKNEKAEFIANASQQGGGESDEQKIFENNAISPIEEDNHQQTDDIVNQQQQQRQQQFQESYLQTTLSWKFVQDDSNKKKDDKEKALEEQEQRIREQIATLETKISTNRQLLAKKSAVETVSSNSTTTGEAAEYIENFRQQAYQVGNRNYPQEARAKNIKGDVRLLVIIDSTGNVKDIKVLGSSGSPLLDNAAKESVYKSAPFGEFSPDMKNILELRIIRTWRFGDTLTVDEE